MMKLLPAITLIILFTGCSSFQKPVPPFNPVTCGVGVWVTPTWYGLQIKSIVKGGLLDRLSVHRKPKNGDYISAMAEKGYQFRHSEYSGKALPFYRKAFALKPDAMRVTEAECAIHEIKNLNPGQQAPLFTMKDYKGRIVDLKNNQYGFRT